MSVFAVAFGLVLSANAQPSDVPPDGGPPTPPPSDIELVRTLNAARDSYRVALENLRTHYWKVGDEQRARWAEQELIEYHRILKQSFRLDVGDVPSEKLEPKYNHREANDLYMRAMSYKDRGFGTEYIDNQRRAELLLQLILTKYPRCNKIGLIAYQLGDLYESRAYRQYRRAAVYFERSFQWDPTAMHDARLRAARVYDRNLREQDKALELYKSVLDHDTDPARRDEAQRRVNELGGGGR